MFRPPRSAYWVPEHLRIKRSKVIELNQFIADVVDLNNDPDVALYESMHADLVTRCLDILSRAVQEHNVIQEATYSPLLHGAIRLLGHFSEPSALSPFQRLLMLDIATIDDLLGDDFVTAEAPSIIAGIAATHWQQLKLTLQSPGINEWVYAALLKALVLLVGQGVVERCDVMEYFCELMAESVSKGKMSDRAYTTALVDSCADLWPAEPLEMIRKLYSLDLVDCATVTLQDVMEDHCNGLPGCLDRLQKRVKSKPPLLGPPHTFDFKIEDLSAFLNKVIDLGWEYPIDGSAEPSIARPGRNDPCPCGSGRKYKKCCKLHPHELEKMRADL